MSNIYPTNEELKDAMEEYLEDNEPEFYKSKEDKDWNTYYEAYLASPVIVLIISNYIAFF